MEPYETVILVPTGDLDAQLSVMPTFSPEDVAHAALVVQILSPVLEGLGKAMLLESEVVLHDLTRFPATIAAISNPLTGRDVGGPISDLGLIVLREPAPEYLANYASRMPDGAASRSSSVFFRGPSGRIVIALCFNSVSREIEMLKAFLERLSPRQNDPAPVENFPASVDQLAKQILEEVLAEADRRHPVSSRADKLAIVTALEKRGFFSLKESVRMASEALQISKFTVYSYLKEISDAYTAP